MRHFDYFLFENFDADVCAQHPQNPRRFLNDASDGILSFVADFPVGTCSYQACERAFDVQLMKRLIAGGILRREGDSLFFDTPVFLREDAAVLRSEASKVAHKLAEEMHRCIPQIRSLCANIRNGFSMEVNLYHILCGMIFDGSFFDYLERSGAVTTSRNHVSGLDYLSVIYEKSPELSSFSDGLLCSYNRFANSYCALQSFGDANGLRQDFYRFFRLMESGNIPASFDVALHLYRTCEGYTKDEILAQVFSLITKGQCAAPVLALLEHFGYVEKGTICVPVYAAAEREIVNEIAAAVEEGVGDAFAAELANLSARNGIIACAHGVSSGEIANELYHILFGLVNEQLVQKGVVAAPPQKHGEGRYLRCIQLE